MDVTYTSAIANVIEKLEAGNPLPLLVPQQEWNAEVTASLEAVSTDAFFEGQALKNTTFGEAVKSGLLLWNDALDASHTISQTLENPTGSYWHGIMHRREPDYSNAKYWFGRVGTHPIFPALRDHALRLLKEIANPSATLAAIAKAVEENEKWDAYQFIDWCKAAENGSDADVTHFLKQVQGEEIKRLLAYSYRNAV